MLTEKIIGAAIEVHRLLGPGLLESTYEKSLTHELQSKGLKVESQILMPIKYKELEVNNGYRIDLIVEKKVVLELKCVEEISLVHEAQILTYLRHSRISTGLIINFNVQLLKHGIKRFILNPKKLDL